MSDEAGYETPRRGRPPRLSREQIVDAALADGLDTLTMASVAARLGVAKSALYRWVQGRDELLGLVSDVVVERILPGELPAGTEWRGWLTTLAHRMRREFLAVPGYAARIAAPHEHHSDAHVRLLTAVTAQLVGAGLTPEEAEQTVRLVMTAFVGWIAAESHWSDRWSDGLADQRFTQFVAALVGAMPPK